MNRILDVLFDPLFVAILLLAAFYLVRRRAPRVAFALPAAALGVLLFFGSPRVAVRLARGLEQAAPATMNAAVTYDAVIVLGGGVDPNITVETGRTAFREPAERMITAFDLLRAGRAKSVLLSGGPWGDARVPLVRSEAGVMADQLEAWGIDAARIVVEERSRNTHENAVESVAIVRARGWGRVLLVTSAAHMPRALACFVHEGLRVDALPVDFHASDPARWPPSWLPRAWAVLESTEVLHEWVGRAVYRARGWTD
jgi:uncharacterized SAM-binding protein YcdF (DUF218 family)